VFGPSRDGATSTCDLILDLSGGAPLFPAHELRPGYLRADPRDRAAVERAIADAGGLVGTFDKPRFIHFEESLCAHSRSGITGCTRCLDLCPTGAITPNGNAVAIDANVCAGCGSCASVCPTGAASYSLPSADALMRRLRTLLQTYRKAGGSNAIVLFHDGEHGEEIIDALARFGAGLPANVLPLRVNEVTQLGPEIIAAVFAYGGSGVAVVTRAKPRHDIPGFAARSRCRTASFPRSASAQAWCGSSRPTIRTSCAPCSMRRLPASRRKSRPASFRAAPNAACWRPRFANSISPRPRRSMSCRWRRARRSAA
jgi:ferredoxin